MKILLIVFFALTMVCSPAFAQGEDLTCNVSGSEVSIGLDPSKETIKVFGKAPEHLPVIIRIEGPDRPVLVSQFQNDSLVKCSEAEVLGLPGFYQVLTSMPIEELARSHWDELGINPSYNQLRSDAWVRMRQDLGEISQARMNDYIDIALKNKDEKHLYTLRQGVIQRKGQDYWAEIPLVAGMPLGDIKVTAMTLVNGQVTSAEPRVVHLKPGSLLSMGSKELSINAVTVISLFMIPIILMTIATVLELLQQHKEQEKRARLLRQIWQ